MVLDGMGMKLSALVGDKFGGSRRKGLLLRTEIEAALDRDDDVVVDFSGFEASQSFIDEFIGVLVLRYGPHVMDRIVFRGCSPDAKAIIAFVVNSRAHDHKVRQIQSQ